MCTELKKFIIPPTGSKHENVSKFKTSSPWKKEDVAFNVQNIYYPTLHTHEYYEILVILSGNIIHTINGNDYNMQQGDCCFIRPEDCHCLIYPSEQIPQNHFLSINFMMTKEFYQKSIACYDFDPIPSVEQDDTPIAFHISNTLREKIRRTCLHIQTPLTQPTVSAVQICKSIIAELLHAAILEHTTRKHANCPMWLQELIIKMQKPENLAKKPAELIKDTPYSRSYVEKSFRKHFGVSILEFKNSVKMSYAKELLSSTSLSISQITEMLGFESISHFSTLFKSSYGISPIQHKKKRYASSSTSKEP